MQLPTGIIFVNSDISEGILSVLKTQLQIHESMDGYEFDSRLLVDPNYATIVHLQKMRILVIRDDFGNLTNRDLADVVIFMSQGLAYVEKNNYGPPNLCLPLFKINIYELLRSVGSPYVKIIR